jgi:formate dehydrogenase maturation protein FdhE
VEGTTKGLRTATYLLRFTPDEKRELEQKVRRAAAAGKNPLSLAEALRMGAKTYLDELLQKYEAEGPEDDGLAAT